ncbi:uncharacterized protein LOC143032531 [Oratosquilla oratoria]|uniref:uncharacterized protein LOC143032531 n=1 Tax=Oratosquilla oratoria TaxID=337810 RepID=UPI003F768ED6
MSSTSTTTKMTTEEEEEDDEKTSVTTVEAEEEEEQRTLRPGNLEVREEGRSALLRNVPKGAQVVFLADDFDAASRIPTLLSGLNGGRDLFPMSRDRGRSSTLVRQVPRDPGTQGRPERTSVFPDDMGVSSSTEGMKAESLDVMDPSERRDHRTPGHRYTGNRYRPRPGSPHGGGTTFINKGDIYTNNIYSGRPGSIRPPFRNMTRVTHIEAECNDDYMRIHVRFNGSFEGLVYSAGYSYDGDCIYVNGSGRYTYDFFIQLNRCGTLGGNEKGKEDIRGRTPMKNMMWNTLTVQYNPLIEEEWDEHFKVTCEYGYDFWKTVTFPFLDVEVKTGNPVVFTLTPPECHMEIRYGYGTSGTRVTGPVRVGDPLTLVIYMRSEFDGFDMVVSDCIAHNGGNKKIALIDHFGCPVDEKLISHFEGTLSSEGIYETQVYAFMKTFRFTGSPALYIECDVRMCHGDCPSQACHWRQGKRERRSLGEESGHSKTPSITPNISESLNLFQALQVVRDDQAPSGGPLRTKDENRVCLKSGTFSVVAGAVAVIIGTLTVSCLTLCFRIRRLRKAEDSLTDPARSSGLTTHFRTEYIPPTNRRLE